MVLAGVAPVAVAAGDTPDTGAGSAPPASEDAGGQPTVAERLTAQEIRDCSRRNLPGRTLVQRLDLEVTDRAGGTQSREARFYLKRYPDYDETRSTLRVLSPIDVRGVSYLMIDRADGEQLFVYLPALQRVRRIQGETAGDSLFGTDLSYADLRQLSAMSAGGTLERLPDARIAERAVYRVALKPAAPETAIYERVVFFIDQATCVPLRTEFYADGAEPAKRLEADPEGLGKIGERWLARKLVMHDLADGTRTVLELSDPRYDEELSDIIFNPRSFYLGASEQRKRQGSG